MLRLETAVVMTAYGIDFPFCCVLLLLQTVSESDLSECYLQYQGHGYFMNWTICTCFG